MGALPCDQNWFALDNICAKNKPNLMLIAYWMPIEQDGTHGVLITKASVVALAMER